jgi:Derlin-2/3
MNARNVNQGASLSEAIMAIPPVTRLLLFATILSGALYTFGVVDAVHFLFIPSKIINEFQIYRLVLPVIFAGKFEFSFAMHLYILYQNCKSYETSPFNTGAGGTSADFLWMVMIGTALLWPIAYYFQIFVLSQPMVYMIMYVWSRRFPDEQRNMFGVFSLKVAYIPWFYVAIHVLMGNSITPILIGIAVGHIYYYIIEVLPRTSNVDLVKTPIFCSKIINYLTGGSQGASPRPAATQQGPNAQRPLNQRANQGFPNVGGGYNWGNGRTLGTQ